MINYTHIYKTNRKERIIYTFALPGRLSLELQQYYANPRNCFWPFVEDLFSIPRDRAYEDRCSMLLAKGVVLWDVLKTWIRAGSLDSGIAESSMVINDFADFFDGHPDIELICFNGAKAEKVFVKRVLPSLPAKPYAKLIRLPSTSPANASASRAFKLERWRVISRGV